MTSYCHGYYVDIGEGWGLKNNKIWTLKIDPPNDNEQRRQQRLPLVLVHGFAAGTALWTLNLDSFASTNRSIYAIDVLGFGKSSRPNFDKSGAAEIELVDSIERWRQKVGLNDKFIILGHSFGGYLSLSYALNYPNRVSHVILADPWGVPSYQQSQSRNNQQLQIPLWVRIIGTMMFHSFNPLAGLRAAGPWGPSIIRKFRTDLVKKFEGLMGPEKADSILDYIYHCNAQHPSGEIAFKSMSLPVGWAKFPMINRITDLDPNITLTFIYGSRSWIDRQPGFQIKYLLGENRVNIFVINGSGHHVYADKYDEFNNIVNNTCYVVDEREVNLANNNQDQVDDDEVDEDFSSQDGSLDVLMDD